MKKFLLIVFVALSTLTSCSSDDNETTNEPATFEDSFSYKIVDVKGFDATGKYYDSGYDKAVNENSKITYNKTDKTVIFIVSGTPNVLTVTSVENELIKANYALGVSNLSVPVKLYKEGNVFVLDLLDTPIKGKFEYTVVWTK